MYIRRPDLSEMPQLSKSNLSLLVSFAQQATFSKSIIFYIIFNLLTSLFFRQQCLSKALSIQLALLAKPTATPIKLCMLRTLFLAMSILTSER